MPTEIEKPADEDYANMMRLRSDQTEPVVLPVQVGPVNFHSLDDFTQAYITCAFWTADPNPHPGEFIIDVEEWDKLSPDDQQQLIQDAASWREEEDVKVKLEQALQCEFKTRGTWESYTEEQAGHDLYLSRNGHGAGFQDRQFRVFIGVPGKDYAYERTLGDELADLAREAGESQLYFFCSNTGDCNGPGNCDACDSRDGSYGMS